MHELVVFNYQIVMTLFKFTDYLKFSHSLEIIFLERDREIISWDFGLHLDLYFSTNSDTHVYKIRPNFQIKFMFFRSTMYNTNNCQPKSDRMNYSKHIVKNELLKISNTNLPLSLKKVRSSKNFKIYLGYILTVMIKTINKLKFTFSFLFFT